MRVVAAAVDRSFERVAGRPGQAREDELLDLPLAVGDRHRPRLVLLLRDVAADLGRAGLDHRRRDGHFFGDGVDLELEVERQRLRRVQRDVVGRGGTEPASRNVDPVPPVGQVRDHVDTGVGRGRLRLDVGVDVGRDHGHADEHAAGRVGHRAVELRSRDLCGRGGAEIKAIRKAEGRVIPTPIRRAVSHLAPPPTGRFTAPGGEACRAAGRPRPRDDTSDALVCGRYRMLAGSCQGGSSIQQIGFWPVELMGLDGCKGAVVQRCRVQGAGCGVPRGRRAGGDVRTPRHRGPTRAFSAARGAGDLRGGSRPRRARRTAACRTR